MPKFDFVESKVLTSTFSNSIPYISNADKLSMIKLAKLNSDALDSEAETNLPVFREPP